MNYQATSIRPFIGSKDFNESRAFYTELGFQEITIEPKMSLFKVNEHLAFYLQAYYTKDWIENTMFVIEVDDIDTCYADILSKNLSDKYPSIKLTNIKYWDWGKEIHLLDPAGVLLHFCEFKK